MLGITVPENFERPFQSTNPSVFWTRWHMSLSFWIRDYVFLPLAMLRREVWWRNLALVIAMVLFGLWHQANVLFLLWGCYHGVLLVLHRQVQWLQRKFGWDPSANLWTPASWITTMALINLGWIFFRANSLSQASQMLTALLSPASYLSHFLRDSLYLLVAGLAAGYGIVLVVAETLDRYPAQQEGLQPDSRSGFVASMARWRWFWIPSLYIVVMLFLLLVTQTQNASTSQFLYRRF